MNDSIKHWLDIIAGVLAVSGTVLTNIATFVAACMSIAWYTYRFLEVRKAKKNGNVKLD